MIRAAGILFVVGDSALFIRRCGNTAMPDRWAFPGGKIEDGEMPEEAAIRETKEEVGYDVAPGALRLWTRTQSNEIVASGDYGDSEDVDFTTYLVRLQEQFVPELDLSEHDGYAWAPISSPPMPLHPGVRIALDRIGMDELGVARAIADGRLTSPQRYQNMWLFAMRVTGTGVSYRSARKEFVWRDPSIYLNDEFLARCNGLEVIWEHPEKGSLLNHKEFHDRKIGNVFLPYFRADKPDEVWCVAKIYDTEAVNEMCAGRLSTSPAVSFSNPSEINERLQLDDGKIMLIEGKPSLLDHLAVCEVGVWDKGGEPAGIESIEAEDCDAVADAVIASTEQIRRDGANYNLLRAVASAFALKSRSAALAAQ